MMKQINQFIWFRLKAGQICTIVLIMAGTGWQACSGPTDRIHQKIDPGKNINISIHPYGRTIFALDPQNIQEGLKAIKDEYPVFLNGDLNDTERLKGFRAFLMDTVLQQLDIESRHIYPDYSPLNQTLNQAFERFHYFFPEEKTPEVYTYISGLDYEHRIQYFDNNLIIAIDLYLGSDYEEYKKLGLPDYVIRHFDEAYLLRDCLYNMGQGQIYKDRIGDKLLDRIINEGKLLWFVNLMVPDIDFSVLFDYSPAQLSWAKDKETMVWAFLLENEMLYAPNPEFKMKWINDAPFTSYFGPDSPPRLGMWVGYRIVNDFMNKNPKIKPRELMQIYDAQKILKQSHYKPDNK